MPRKLKTIISQTEAADYMEFLSTVQLVGMGLKSSSASIDRMVFFDLVEEKKPVRHLSEEYASTDVGKDYFNLEGRYKIAVADEARTGLLIQFVFEVHMHAKGPVDPQMAKRFANSDLRFILLPYARQFVTDITGQMQIPPVVLPLATAAGRARLPKTRKES
jgi:hypothetical protein